MSLINDALKKAARQRAQEQDGDLAPLMPGGGGRSSARNPSRAQNLVLIGGAAVALAVVSAVVTGIFVSGKSAPKGAAPAAQAAAQAVQPAPQPPAASVHVPQITVPSAAAPVAQAPAPAAAATAEAQPRAREAVVTLPPAQAAVHVSETTPAPAPARTQQPPAPAPTAPPLQVAATAPVTAAPAPSPTPAAILSLSERVQAVIDRIQISGVRFSGTDSKAIIDGHIYRANDVLDRTLGIRLSKFDQDHLTFVDPTGATYVKSF